MKYVYFVRHGESELNAEKIRQGREGHLSEKGRDQAEAVGLRLTTIPIDKIIASSYPRAYETAEIINKFINKPIEKSELFIERKNPSEIVGKWADDFEVRKIVDFIDKSFHQNNVRYSDEENFEDLKARAKKAIKFLEEQKEDRLLVVTHGIFMVMIVAYLKSKDDLSAEEYVKRTFFNPIKNSGITLATYSEPIFWGRGQWRVVSWNDDPYVQYEMKTVEEN